MLYILQIKKCMITTKGQWPTCISFYTNILLNIGSDLNYYFISAFHQLCCFSACVDMWLWQQSIFERVLSCLSFWRKRWYGHFHKHPRECTRYHSFWRMPCLRKWIPTQFLFSLLVNLHICCKSNVVLSCIWWFLSFIKYTHSCNVVCLMTFCVFRLYLTLQIWIL